mmetsp:Transcript_15457/g.53889  ORF Transcript_15457/g.53889 Transcript_15457/m.53889 type:complete len:222 (-) Transcript_15457:47-712(-)
MRPRGSLVHQRRGRCPVLQTKLHPTQSARLLDDLCSEAADVDALPRVLVQLALLAALCEQVAHLLVVNFQAGALYDHLRARRVLDEVAGLQEHVLKAQRDHARVRPLALHGVRLAAARLAVGEDSAVEPLEDRCHQRPAGRVEELPLRRSAIEDRVKGKCAFVVGAEDVDLVPVDLDAGRGAVGGVLCRRRSTADHHLHRAHIGHATAGQASRPGPGGAAE